MNREDVAFWMLIALVLVAVASVWGAAWLSTKLAGWMVTPFSVTLAVFYAFVAAGLRILINICRGKG